MSEYHVYRDFEGWETYMVEADSEKEAREKVERKARNYELEDLDQVGDSLGHTHTGTVAEKI